MFHRVRCVKTMNLKFQTAQTVPHVTIPCRQKLTKVISLQLSDFVEITSLKITR